MSINNMILSAIERIEALEAKDSFIWTEEDLQQAKEKPYLYTPKALKRIKDINSGKAKYSSKTYSSAEEMFADFGIDLKKRNKK